MLVSSPDSDQTFGNNAELLNVVDIDVEDNSDDATSTSVGVYAQEIFYYLRQSEVCTYTYTCTYMLYIYSTSSVI